MNAKNERDIDSLANLTYATRTLERHCDWINAIVFYPRVERGSQLKRLNNLKETLQMSRTATNLWNPTDKWQSGWGCRVQKVRQVLKSQLNRKTKVQIINMYAMLVIRHPSGELACLKEEMEATDVKTPWCMEGFTQTPASWDHTLREKRDAED